MGQCYYCRTALSAEVQRKNRLCPNCGSDIHCCRNCTNYRENLSNKCAEPNGPWIADRAKQNSCSWFEFATANSPSSPENQESAAEAEKAKAAFRALFRQA